DMDDVDAARQLLFDDSRSLEPTIRFLLFSCCVLLSSSPPADDGLKAEHAKRGSQFSGRNEERRMSEESLTVSSKRPQALPFAFPIELELGRIVNRQHPLFSRRPLNCLREVSRQDPVHGDSLVP